MAKTTCLTAVKLASFSTMDTGDDERCRVCLKESLPDSSMLFTGEKPIYHRLELAAGFQIKYSKKLPSKICVHCLNELDIAYEFRRKCEASELTLQQCIKIENIDDPPPVNNSNNITDESIDDDHTDYFDDGLECFEKDHKIEQEKDVRVTKRKNNRTPKSKSRASKTSQKKKENEIKVDIKQQISKDDKSNKREKTKKHMCATCGKTFQFHGNLKAHERIHSGDKPFKCTTCNQRFAQSGHLLVHERTHSGVKPYQCDICAKCFTVSHSLKKHIKTHTGEKPYTCIICSKCFSTSYHLSNHFKTHSDEQVYECDWPECQTRVYSKREMNLHKLKHEPASESRKEFTYGALNYVKTTV
ncbi:uncharacterized protein LOC143919887 [Arctopsyche grandis]|uniref:uncharacterized protein LOC143919887 n=1 Tax=Arctopsyche grandis TaxID=121162 RepID=UPI00406D6F6F